MTVVPTKPTMSDSNDNFARDFFTRPENDDTIEQFKRQYMNSKKNYQLAMDSNNDTNPSGGRFDERDIGSPPSKPHPRTNGPSSVRNHNVATSRLSSTATLSNNDDHQDLSMLRDEVQKLINAREKDNFDKINLKSALNNLDSRLNNLENVILKSQSQSQSQSINNSSRPQSYESYGRNTLYNKRKDESYDYMLKDELRRNGYRDSPQYYNKIKNSYINHTNYIPPSPPQRYATSSARYSSPPPPPPLNLAQQRYYSDSYEYDHNKRIDDPPYRSNRYNDDASTIDLINGRI